MGRAKALLTAGGRTFVATAVELLRAGGCGAVLVVVADPRAGRDPAIEAAARAAAPDAVVDAPPGGEQIDSLRAGLRALDPGTAAALVLPVDHPLVAPETIHAIIAASQDGAGAVVRPTHGGRPGHPTLFPAAVWPRLMDHALPRGARSVLEAEDVDVVDVPVLDEGVLADIDTPEQYERWIGQG